MAENSDTGSDRDTVADLSEQLAAARQEVQDLSARNERLEALCSAMQGLPGDLDLGTLNDAFETGIKGIIPYDATSVNMLTGERNFEHLKSGEIVTAPGPIGQAGSATDWVVQNRKPLIRQDLLADKRFRVSNRTRDSGIRSDVVVPLIVRDEVIGTVAVASFDTNAYSESDVEFLAPLVEKLSMLVSNGRLYRELRAAYQDLKLIYDGVSDLVFLVQVVDGAPGPFVSVNRAFLEVTGLVEADVIGRAFSDVVPPEAAEYVGRKCQQAIDDGRPISFEGNVALPAREVTVEGSVAPMFDEDGRPEHVLGVASNISEKRQAEREFIRLERLHALGDLARGVAHNFNNILVGVLGYAQLIEMQSKDASAVDSAKHIVESALRAKDLVQRLNLSVGKGSESPPERVDDLAAVVGEAVEATRPKWQDEMQAEGVTISVETSIDEVAPVRANPVGLQHIIANLISNAVDAMPDGGEIHITATAADDRVHLQVSDTGVGMDDAVQRRVFDPFFTTRQDVGSGLGLAMAYRSLTEWGGDVTVDSKVGRGTTFNLALPVWDADPRADGDSDAPRGRVLVVDDEWAVRQVLQRALRDYRLEVFSRVSDAIGRLETGKFDLALIDLGLPGVPGNELATRMKQDNPEVVTVLITGWEVSDGDPRLMDFDYHLRKPFGLSEIRDLVERALGGSHSG